MTDLRKHRWLKFPSLAIDALEARLTRVAFTAEEVMVRAVLDGGLMR